MPESINFEDSFVIPVEECEKRIEQGEGVREDDQPVSPELHTALGKLHKKITAVRTVAQSSPEGKEKEIELDLFEDAKAYPNNVEFGKPQNTAERQKDVASKLAKIIINQLETSLTDSSPYGAPVAYLISSLETFLTIDQPELKKAGIRLGKTPEATHDRHEIWLQTLLQRDVSEKVQEYMQTLKINEETPFAQSGFEVTRIVDPTYCLSLRLSKYLM